MVIGGVVETSVLVTLALVVVGLAEVEFEVGVDISVVVFTSSVVIGIIVVVLFSTGASEVVKLIGASLVVGLDCVTPESVVGATPDPGPNPEPIIVRFSSVAVTPEFVIGPIPLILDPPPGAAAVVGFASVTPEYGNTFAEYSNSSSMVAITRLSVYLAFTHITGSTVTGKTNKRQLIVGFKWAVR